MARVISGERSRTLDEVKVRAARLARGLQSRGIGHGDRFAIMLRNETAFLEATLAAAPLGAVPVPVNWHWTGADLKHLLSDSGSKIVLAHSTFLPAIEAQKPDAMQIIEVEVPPEVDAAYGTKTPLSGKYETLEQIIARNEPIEAGPVAPPMAVIYTSGTTGLAKGILRHPIKPADFPGLAKLLFGALKLFAGEPTAMPAPLYHTAPNVAATFGVAAGMDIVMMARFDAKEFLKLVDRYKLTTVQMVPTMFTRLLALPKEVRAKYDLSSLRAIVHAAAPCPPDIKRAMIEWLGPILFEYYGGSEGGIWVFCTSEEWLAHPGTVGKPIGDADIKILGPHREELPRGQTGDIFGRSFSVWPDFTYIGNEAKRREMDHHGYVHLGDVGHLDDDGFLFLSDRRNDMIIAGGVNVYPAEIETCLSSMPGVQDSAVFGIPDADLGEAIAAHVQLWPGSKVSEDDVRAWVRDHLAKYKVPKVVKFEAQLPREDSGKLFKRRLKAQYWPAKPSQ